MYYNYCNSYQQIYRQSSTYHYAYGMRRSQGQFYASCTEYVKGSLRASCRLCFKEALSLTIMKEVNAAGLQKSVSVGKMLSGV